MRTASEVARALRCGARAQPIRPAGISDRLARRFRKRPRAQIFGRCIVSRTIGEQRNCGNF
jgi:hypothetical protein